MSNHRLKQFIFLGPDSPIAPIASVYMVLIRPCSPLKQIAKATNSKRSKMASDSKSLNYYNALSIEHLKSISKQLMVDAASGISKKVDLIFLYLFWLSVSFQVQLKVLLHYL